MNRPRLGIASPLVPNTPADISIDTGWKRMLRHQREELAKMSPEEQELRAVFYQAHQSAHKRSKHRSVSLPRFSWDEVGE